MQHATFDPMVRRKKVAMRNSQNISTSHTNNQDIEAQNLLQDASQASQPPASVVSPQAVQVAS